MGLWNGKLLPFGGLPQNSVKFQNRLPGWLGVIPSYNAKALTPSLSPGSFLCDTINIYL